MEQGEPKCVSNRVLVFIVALSLRERIAELQFRPMPFRSCESALLKLTSANFSRSEKATLVESRC